MDVPYAAFPSHLASHQLKDSLFVLLERNASEWATHRMSDHGGRFGSNPICHERLWEFISSPLDLQECVSVCLARQRESPRTRCLIRHSELSHTQLMVAYARHRQRLSELFGDRLLRMNLFAQDGQIPAAALQANLESELCSRELKSCDPTPDVTLRFHE